MNILLSGPAITNAQKPPGEWPSKRIFPCEILQVNVDAGRGIAPIPCGLRRMVASKKGGQILSAPCKTKITNVSKRDWLRARQQFSVLLLPEL